jgi:predicted methyltransferase
VVLDFVGAVPTMKVLDFIAGGGYYAELLARIVGERGRVIAYNTPRTREFVSARLAERYAGERLPNVESLIATRDDLYLSIESVDAALFIMVYHDFYLPGPGGAAPVDPLPMLMLVKRALRPGGIVVVQDHVANPGGDPGVVAATLHRIDPAVVRRDFAAAGFEFESESDALRNPADDHTQKVFEPGVRYRTDRFMYRFRKPAK